VAKQMPENKIGLKKLVQSAMHRLQKLPDVVKSFFRHPEYVQKTPTILPHGEHR
jgi:hypothetical protein